MGLRRNRQTPAAGPGRCRRRPREASAAIARCRTTRRACRCVRGCQSQGSPGDQRAARRSRKSAWPAGDGPCRSSRARRIARRTRRETPRGPREMRGCERRRREASDHRGWRIVVHARNGFKRRKGSEQYARSKSCRDFQGSLRYSHAGVAEWQTRRTQNPLVARPCGFDSLLRHQHFFATERAFFIARYSTRIDRPSR